MFRTKRLYIFVLETFLPVILATFSVCLFILLMQFLWQYVEDMVGKGVELSVLGEMFFYAMLGFVPMALPLSILLASLMTFGNLGEHFELLAMKASGISLIRIMKPLIILVIFISGISFVFQNNVQPPAQKKWLTILYSLKQKSPELEIPKDTFYKGLKGYNIYVRDRAKDGLLLDVMIYNYSRGAAADMEVILADSGRVKTSADSKYMILTLYNGETFQNLPNNSKSKSRTKSKTDQIPYMRETFTLKEYLIDHDSSFNMADESIFDNRDASKNVRSLKIFADSLKQETDSISGLYAVELKKQIYEIPFIQSHTNPRVREDTEDTTYIHDFQLFFEHSSLAKQIAYLEGAKSKVDYVANDYITKESMQTEMYKQMRSHDVEFYKKFSLSIACLFFFFIGAPLGAIIRKGGLGMPAVLSVIIFLLYYTLDTFGIKMAKTGVWPVWQGVWLSSVLLISLGSFFTYKAVNDSVIMNPDVWKDILQRLIGKKDLRNYARKEVIITPPNYEDDMEKMNEWNTLAKEYLNKHKRIPFYISFWKQNFHDPKLTELIERMESWIDDLRNSDENLIIGKLMDYPVIRPQQIQMLNNTALKWFCALCIPVGLIIYLFARYSIKQVHRDLNTTLKVNKDLCTELEKLNNKHV